MGITSLPSTIDPAMARHEKPPDAAEVLQHHLLHPFSYLAIRHGHKLRLDWIWPGALTAVTVAGYYALPVQPALLGSNGILQGVRDLIMLLSAFSVVALVAVASLARGSLDEFMPQSELTRRRFALHLFGYLAVLCFLLFLAMIGAQAVVPSLHVLLSRQGFFWVKLVTGTVFALAVWNTTVATVLGVSFLIKRINVETDASRLTDAEG